MAGLKFDHCCCCINLRIGSLILGWLGLIGSILAVAGTAVGMVGIEDSNHQTVKIPPSIGWPVIIVYAICFLFYLMLLVGIYQRKAGLVNAAWIYMVVGAVLYTILNLANSQNHAVAPIIGVILGFCLSLYWALCVRSYYIELKGEGFQPAHGHA